MENKKTNDNNTQKPKRKTDKQNVILIIALGIMAIQIISFVDNYAREEVQEKQRRAFYKIDKDAR